MSENFELVQSPFLRGLNSLSSFQQAHVAQQSRRDKLRTASPQICPPQINPHFSIQSQDIDESRCSVISRCQYPGLSSIGSLIPLQDPSGMMMMDFRSSSEAFAPIKEDDDDSIRWKSLNSQSNTDYPINYLQNHGTQNSVVSPTVLGPVCGGGGVPILYSTTVPSVVNQGGPKSSTELMIPCVFAEGSMQRNPVNQSQILASHMPQEIMIREQSQELLIPSFGNSQSEFYEWNQIPWGSRTRTDPKGQGLSLSLSFHNPQEHLHMQTSRFPAQNNFTTIHSFVRDEKQKEGFAGEPSAFSKESPCLLPAAVHRNPVPVWPFTGYASVLKNSKFLKPAQQLLDECCNSVRMKMVLGSVTEKGVGGKFLLPPNAPAEIAGISCGLSGDHRILATANPACTSSCSSGLPPANTVHHDPSSSTDCDKHQRKKNRLVWMLDEVCRRYRHYYQQLQMVVTSFESIAGLSAAAPYTSMTIRVMTKNFRCLKSAINGQLKSTCQLLGEDRPEPGTWSPARDHEDMLGNSEDMNLARPPPQHIWRPQRGLPERAVLVLRAWLFEHFLHPYPTDTDKQILARRTGLTRNQVSNWFINARVRLWKPMVEEIHSLETRTSSSVMDLNSARTNAGGPSSSLTAAEEISTERNHHDKLIFHTQPENHPYNGGDSSETLQNIIQPIKQSSSGFSPMLAGTDDGRALSYPGQTEVYSDVAGHVRTPGGVGGVSLTLALHHNGMIAHDAQNRHPENIDANNEMINALDDMDSLQMRNRIDGQLIHDFVG